MSFLSPSFYQGGGAYHPQLLITWAVQLWEVPAVLPHMWAVQLWEVPAVLPHVWAVQLWEVPAVLPRMW